MVEREKRCLSEVGAGDAPAGGSPPRAMGLIAFAAPLALYVATLAPTVTLEDSGEFITAAFWLGVPHASGYPLWCLIAHAFTWLPFGTVAERVHLSSATFGAATAWLVYLVVLRLFADWRAGLTAALGLAASSVLWSQSVIAEVYALNAFFTILLVYLVLRWRESRDLRWLYAVVFATGLGLTNHHMLSLVALPVFVWLLALDARALLRPRVIVLGGALLLLGLSVYAYLPIRAAADQPLNVGDPSTVAGFVKHLRREAYFGATEAGRAVGSTRDVVLHTGAAWIDAGRSFGWPLALLGLLGLVAWPRGQRDVRAVTVAIALGNTLLLTALLTPPYVPAWVYLHRIFFIPAHVMVALWIGAGASVLLAAAARRGTVAWHAVTAALALVLVVAAWSGFRVNDRRDDQIARNLALDLLDSAPPAAGFLPIGDDVLYPVLYARDVEGRRPDVHLVSRDYGWRREPISVLLAGDVPGEQLRADLPALRDVVAVPHGLVYALVPRSAAAEAGYGSFVPLPGPPRDQGLENAREDLFIDAVRARYASYHARVGARALAHGDRTAGLAALDRAATLDPGDPHVKVLLFEIYRHFGVRPERWRPLLESALHDHDRTYDPHAARYDPLTRADIERHLASLP